MVTKADGKVVGTGSVTGSFATSEVDPNQWTKMEVRQRLSLAHGGRPRAACWGLCESGLVSSSHVAR